MGAEIIAAGAGIIGTVIVSIFTYLMARKAGIGPYQDSLVSTLKNLVDVHKQEIQILQDDKKELADRVAVLEEEIRALKELTVRQALRISTLEKAAKGRPRVREKTATLSQP